MFKSLSVFFKENSAISIFCSFSIFLFSALSLVLPSGFSYGALLLVLGSLVLLVYRPRFHLQQHEWIFILTLLGYFTINALLNLYHELPTSAYDKPSRYLLVIPVYLLLINYPPKINYYWYGLMFAAIGTFFIAIYQQLFYLSGRSVGFLNAIQFGCIGILFCGLLLVGVLCPHSSKNRIFAFVFFSVIAVVASSLSFSRGAYFVLVKQNRTLSFENFQS